MKTQEIYGIVVLLLFTGAATGGLSSQGELEATDTNRRASGPIAAVVGFGSCNRHDAGQSYWTTIANELRHSRNVDREHEAESGSSLMADAFLWIGDVVYADTRLAPAVWVESPIETIRSKYEVQRANPYYSTFVQRDVAVVNGVWDDHDMGKNDGGKEFAGKDDVQKIFLDFLDVAADSERRQQKGLYTVQRIAMPKEHPLAAFYRFSVCALLLDVRYFRDEWDTASDVPDPDGGIGTAAGGGGGDDMLGETQWKWLEKELLHVGEDCAVTLVASGVQVLMDVMPTEQWGTFARSRSRLYSTIRCLGADRVIFISGDVHFGEVSTDGTPAAIAALGYPIVEAKSSGLTHTAGELMFLRPLFHVIFPSHRRRSVLLAKNFGSVVLSGTTPSDATVTIRVHSLESDDEGSTRKDGGVGVKASIGLVLKIDELQSRHRPMKAKRHQRGNASSIDGDDVGRTKLALSECRVVPFEAESPPLVKRSLQLLLRLLPRQVKMYHLIYACALGFAGAVGLVAVFLIWKVACSIRRLSHLVDVKCMFKHRELKPKQG